MRSKYWITLLCFVAVSLQANILVPLPELSNKQAVSDSTSLNLEEFSQRQRIVAYDHNHLFRHDKLTKTKIGVEPTLKLELFKDKVIHAKVTRSYQRADGKSVWLGQVVGEANSAVNIIANKQQLTANIRSKGQVFQIRTQSDGNVRVNQFVAPKKSFSDLLPATLGKQTSAAKQPQQNPVLNTELPIYSSVADGFSDSADVTVLVYYTKQALEEIPDLLDVIDLDFIDTNRAFENSGVQASVLIAAKIAVDESPISGGLAFAELTGKKGPFTNVDEIRKKYQADLVHFYPLRLKDACGLAYYAAFPDGWAERDFGFGATAAYCTGNLTTAHELGHNFGAAHDRYVENGGTDASNYGYVDVANEFQTIMSYTDECIDNGVYCSEITHFSNPDKTYNEFSTGVAEPTSQATNNAAQLNYSGLTLANFFGVATPVISSVSQGDSVGVQLKWSEIGNATSYRVKRREASFDDFSGPLCSYPVYGDEFEVLTNQYTDTTAIDGKTYCYSVVALNEQLLGETYSPESFVRTGYQGSDDSLVLPFIDDITLDNTTRSLQKTLILPNTFEYQLVLVEHSLEHPPTVQLAAVTDEEYTLELNAITLANQSLTIGLEATHKTSGIKVAQLFNVFSSNIENQPSIITVPSTIDVDQQSTKEFEITVTDDQTIAADGIYAYSRDEELLSQVNVIKNEDGQFLLAITHSGLKTGESDIVIGYSDGEYLTEAITTVKVKRTIFNPTQTQDVTWYINAGGSITRLLPFYDIDEGEVLTVSLLNEPQSGELGFDLSDKVTYTANSDFTRDSFSFYVTGEDGVSTENVSVTIELSKNLILTPKQQISSSWTGNAFLSHLGDLYTWGWNKSGDSALGSNYENIEYVFEPTKVNGNDWVDVAKGQNNLYALKKDGTLWFVGLDTINDSRSREFTQMGTDNDWLSINSSGVGSPIFIKTDGSIWSRARTGYIAITNREEYADSMANLSQIVPLYKIRSAKSNGDMSVALDSNNNLLSWGSNRLSDLGRSESLGYIAPIELIGEFTHLQSAIFRSIVLSGQKLFYWGRGSTELKLGITEDLPLPTQISNENWKSVSLGVDHMAGIKADGSLWTWGGQRYTNGEPLDNAYLARGENPNLSIAQVGYNANWLDVWSSGSATYTLDDTGQLWVAGGSTELRQPIGLPENQDIAYVLTPLTTIPTEVTGTGDVDNDQILDYLDTDDDNDNVLDQYDAFRTDASESLDTDLDGIGNNADTDDDGDSVNDTEDAFPLDASESVDTDADGVGNNADNDDDGDGVNDNNDDYPLDPSRTTKPVTTTAVNNAESSGGGSLGYLFLFILLLGVCRVTKSKKHYYI